MYQSILYSTLLAAVLSVTASTQVLAASTEWKDIGGGKARLIALKNPVNDEISGAVEVKLDKGWKTYWKSPGGSGIAPEFDFSRSRGFYPEPVKFPVPEWIELQDASFFGYTEAVSFPFTGDGEAATELKLDMLIGVCEEICIPATASFEIGADALNTSDARSQMGVDLAFSGMPGSRSAGNMNARITREGRVLTASYEDSRSAGKLVAVLEVPGKWISDPVVILPSGSGRRMASFTLPDTVGDQYDASSWRLSVIEMADDGGAVKKMTEITGFEAP